MIDPPIVTGPRLRALRLALEYDEQQEFARALKIKKNTYSEVENGKRAVSLKLADKLHSTFSIPLEYTFYGDESRLSSHLRRAISTVA